MLLTDAGTTNWAKLWEGVGVLVLQTLFVRLYLYHLVFHYNSTVCCMSALFVPDTLLWPQSPLHCRSSFCCRPLTAWQLQSVWRSHGSGFTVPPCSSWPNSHKQRAGTAACTNASKWNYTFKAVMAGMRYTVAPENLYSGWTEVCLCCWQITELSHSITHSSHISKNSSVVEIKSNSLTALLLRLILPRNERDNVLGMLSKAC